LTIATQPTPKDLSFDEKIAKIQRYLPEGLTEKILSQRDRIEGERRQVTVMFCDMEGFTALTERLGPEEAYSIMDQVYEILIHKVHDYEGTVNELTGDGIVALFGAPIALEDAPQRAIRSAMAIHREMVKFSDRMGKERERIPPLRMRVGIHSGPVVVGTLGNDLRVEFKAVGDTVNLASRMEELAKPGTTYVTEEIFRLTEGLFRFEALGEKEVKGKEESFHVYQVIAPSTRRTRFDVSAERGLTPFVGRERELEILLDGFDRAKQGAGQAFSIVAEAGVGKSRLLYEFRKSVTNEDMTFLEGRSLSYSRGIAYHPVIDVLKSSYDIKEEDGASQIREKVEEGVKAIGADEATTLPYLLDLLSAEQKQIESIPVTPETRKARIIEALKGIVLKSSEIRPLIMAFEDLHWVDRSSEQVLKSLMESVPGARVLLIFTYRPEFVHTWGGKSYHSQLNLNRLSNRESLAMVTHLLSTEDLDRALEELILKKTEGIPFYIEEFVKSLTDLKIVERENNRYHLAKDAQEVSIPSTVQDVIMARIDSLPEGAKKVLQTGAVIDREFSYELLRRVTGLSEQELLSPLSGLRDSELLYERGVYPQSTYIFKHALTQEVAYNGLLSKRRKKIHENIGEAIEELYLEKLEEYYELLAYHYVRSDNKQKAVNFLDLANQKATGAQAMEEAKAHFDQAMEVLDTLPEIDENRERRISLLTNQWVVFFYLVRPQDYQDLLVRYESVVAEVKNPALLAAFYAALGTSQYQLALFDQLIRNSAKAAELYEVSGNVEDAALAYTYLALGHIQKGDLEKGLMIAESALSKIEERSNLSVYARALTAASFAYSGLGLWDKAVRVGQRTLELAEEFSDYSIMCQAGYLISFAHNQKGDLISAAEYGELAVQKAPTAAFKMFARIFLAWSWCRAGELEEATDVLESSLQRLRAGQNRLGELICVRVLTEAYLLAGEYDKAMQTGKDSLELATRHGATIYVAWATRLLAEISLKYNPAEARSHFEKAIHIFQQKKAENELALAYSGMGRYHKQQRNAEKAREYLTKALEIFERLGTLTEPDKVREELAGLEFFHDHK
jgi:class 3 adenylate cyclase/tetratricopeptide (TPR) repeat protein